MGYTFRTSGPWGAGSSGNLTPAQVDQNFWQAIQDIQEKAVQGIGISNFLVEGDQMTVELSDHSLLGPYTLPIAQLSFQGEWIPNHSYLANDVITHGGATYLVRMDHTSEATFDPGANDGRANDFYGLLLSNPALTIPSGGAIGMMLFKATAADYSMLWDWPTLQGLHDVVQTPGPAVGDLVYWNGSNFGYLASITTFAALNDVQQSPPAADGEVVYWDETLGLFSFKSAAGGKLADLNDVQHSPPAQDGQVIYWNEAEQQFRFKQLSLPDLADVDDELILDPTGAPTAKMNVGDLLTYDGSQWTSRPVQPYLDWDHDVLTLSNSLVNHYINMSGSGVQTIFVGTQANMDWVAGVTFKFRQNDGTVVVDADTGILLDVPPGRLAQPRCNGSLMTLTYYDRFYTGWGQIHDNWAVEGDLAYDIVTLPSTGGNIDMSIDTEVYRVTPTANGSFNLSGAPVGKRAVVIITTSGTTSYTLTFTGGKTTATLATGTVSGKVFTVSFLGDGTNMVETSRTTAM
jgi:hypothetical protein